MTIRLCMECQKKFDNRELIWINDNYGIPWKKVCNGCYDKVREEIRNNYYGDELTYEELYGDDLKPCRLY